MVSVAADDGEEFVERPGMERRLVLRVLKHWRRLAGAERFPRSSAFSAEAMPEEWPNCFLLVLGRYRDDPLLRSCGEGFTHPPPSLVAMSHISALPRLTLIGQATLLWQEALEREVPITRGGAFVGSGGAEIKYRAIVLPVSDRPGEVTHLLGAANSTEQRDS